MQGRGDVGVEDYAEGAFGVFGEGHGGWDEVAEAADGRGERLEEVGRPEVEIYDADCYGGDRS